MEKIGKLLKIHSILIIGVICFLDLLAAQAEPCISAIFRASSDSNVGCQQAGPNLHFAHVNGSPVSFNYVAGSTVLYYDHQIESKSLGCFSQSLLEVGNNLFSINYVYGDSRSTPRVTGSASAQFILNPGATFQQLLCSATFANGSHNGYSCQTQVHLSLSEIDPVLASDIERLKNETTRQLIELRSIDELRPELDALRDLLAEIGSRDFDSLTSDEVLAISQELQESAELIRGFKIEIEQLRVQLFEELSDLRTYFEDIRQVVSNDLRAQGIHPDHQELYQNPSLEDLVFSETELGTVKSQSDTLNSEHNLYKTLADRTVARLQEKFAQKSWVQANLIIESWSYTQGVLAHLLQNREGTAKVSELRSFNESARHVRTMIAEYFDEDGFLKKSLIPEEIKNSINHRLKPEEPMRARALKDAFNEWKNEELTSVQQMVLESVRGLSAGYEVLQGSIEDIADLPSLKTRLQEIFDGTIEAVKMAGRVGMAFTPVGKFVDFCEVATGKEFCLPTGRTLSVKERALSAVGTLMGSGEFWRRLGSVCSIGSIQKVGNKAGNIFSRALKGQKYGPLRKGPLHFIKTKSGSFVSDTFRGSSYIGYVLKEDLIVYRTWGGSAGPVSSYWTKAKPKGPFQATLDSALDPAWGNTAVKWSRLVIPKGTQVFEGVTAEVRLATGKLFGGGSQIYLNQRIPKSWVLEIGTEFDQLL